MPPQTAIGVVPREIGNKQMVYFNQERQKRIEKEVKHHLDLQVWPVNPSIVSPAQKPESNKGVGISRDPQRIRAGRPWRYLTVPVGKPCIFCGCNGNPLWSFTMGG